jgi:hypothetical protein
VVGVVVVPVGLEKISLHAAAADFRSLAQGQCRTRLVWFFANSSVNFLHTDTVSPVTL